MDTSTPERNVFCKENQGHQNSMPSVGQTEETIEDGAEHFFNETLEMSPEDIQRTLSANMPLTRY